MLAVISIYPFVWMVLTSLRDRNTVFTGPFIPEDFKFGAYPEAWRETNFGHHLRNTLVIAGLSLTGIMVLSTTAGYAFAKLRFPFKRTIYILLLSTMAMPATSLVIPLYLQVKRLGLLDTTLGLILVYVGSMSPFSIFLMRAFFATLPDDLIEAARLDGASELKIFRKVMLPLAKAGVGTVVILQFLALWNEFLYANVLLQDPDKHPLQPVVFNLVGAVQHAVEPAHRRADDGHRARRHRLRADAEEVRRRPHPRRHQMTPPPTPNSTAEVPHVPVPRSASSTSTSPTSTAPSTSTRATSSCPSSKPRSSTPTRRGSTAAPSSSASTASTGSRRAGSPTTCSSGSATSDSRVTGLDERAELLHEAGVRFHLEPLDATGNVRITFFFDPDGVLLEFIQGHLDHHEVWNAGIVEEVHARPLPARPTFDHVAMTARDHDATVDFYRSTLGFDVGGRLFLKDDPRGFDITYLHAGETVIELFTFAADKSASPWSADETTIGFRHVGFDVDQSSGATVDDVAGRLAEQGATPVADSPCPLMLDRDGFPLRIGD